MAHGVFLARSREVARDVVVLIERFRVQLLLLGTVVRHPSSSRDARVEWAGRQDHRGEAAREERCLVRAGECLPYVGSKWFPGALCVNEINSPTAYVHPSVAGREHARAILVIFQSI